MVLGVHLHRPVFLAVAGFCPLENIGGIVASVREPDLNRPGVVVKLVGENVIEQVEEFFHGITCARVVDDVTMRNRLGAYTFVAQNLPWAEKHFDGCRSVHLGLDARVFQIWMEKRDAVVEWELLLPLEVADVLGDVVEIECSFRADDIKAFPLGKLADAVSDLLEHCEEVLVVSLIVVVDEQQAVDDVTAIGFVVELGPFRTLVRAFHRDGEIAKNRFEVGFFERGFRVAFEIGVQVNIHSQIRIGETEDHVAGMASDFGLPVLFLFNAVEILIDGATTLPTEFRENFIGDQSANFFSGCGFGHE